MPPGKEPESLRAKAATSRPQKIEAGHDTRFSLGRLLRKRATFRGIEALAAGVCI